MTQISSHLWPENNASGNCHISKLCHAIFYLRDYWEIFQMFCQKFILFIKNSVQWHTSLYRQSSGYSTIKIIMQQYSLDINNKLVQVLQIWNQSLSHIFRTYCWWLSRVGHQADSAWAFSFSYNFIPHHLVPWKTRLLSYEDHDDSQDQEDIEIKIKKDK